MILRFLTKKMKLPEEWQFLFATRFWAMVLGAVALYLRSKGFIGEEEAILVATVLGGFIGVKTIDRLGENLK